MLKNLRILTKTEADCNCPSDLKTSWIKSVFICASILSSIFVCLFFYRLTGSEAMFVFLAVPVVVIGRFWGQKGGMLAGLGGALLAALLMYKIGPEGEIRIHVVMVVTIFLVNIGGVIGRLSDSLNRILKNELRYRSLFEQTHDGIFMTDAQGAVVEWNRREEEITGLKQAEAAGSPIWDALYGSFPSDQRNPEIHKKVKSGILCILKKTEEPFVHMIIEQPSRSKGEAAGIVQHSLFPVRTESGCVVGGISRSIRELKVEEDELSEIIVKIQERSSDEKVLSGFLPICIKCKNIRDKHGNWHQVEVYFKDHSTANFSHTLCPECAKRMYPTFMKAEEKE